MATFASRPAWEPRARAIGNVRFLVPLVLGALVAVSLLVRTRDFGVGFWIDEGLSIGIADRPLGDIPGALRMDGSPPLYYVLLHFWIAAAGRSEEATHVFSLLTSLLAIPAGWWASRMLFGARAGWMGAVLWATSPFLTRYAQETRMYSLVMLLGLLACAAFARAYVLTGTADAPGAAARRRWAIAFAVTLAALLYTHNWAIFFAAGCGAAWLGVAAAAPPGARRELLRDALIGFGGALVLYAPWLPTTLYQAANTGAPWSHAPNITELLRAPGRLLGDVAQLCLFLAAGTGLAALFGGAGWRLSPRARAVAALAVVWLGTLLLAWGASQLSPAWAARYLAVGLPPLLLLASAGLAHAGRLGLVGLAVVALIWIGDTAPSEKSNVREVAGAIAPSLEPGDLVVSTQPEQIPVLAYYLPDGLRYATLTGTVGDLGVADWRDGVERLRATSAERDLEPLLDALPSGRRLVLVEPIVYDIGRWTAPWTELVRVRSTEWRQFVSNDPRFRASAVRPATFGPAGPIPLRATVLVKG